MRPDLIRIYQRGPLIWLNLMQVDLGREFMRKFSKLIRACNLKNRRDRVKTHRDQGIVERLNQTLAERTFEHQYAQEFLFTAR